MDKQLKKEIIKLVKGECANYDRHFCNINHYCCGLDKTCLFLMEDEQLRRCRYFEKGVLPLDGNLEKKYHAYHSGGQEYITPNNAKSKIRCKRCGVHIEANSNRQKYCESCRSYIKREQVKNSMKKKRGKVSGCEPLGVYES